MQIIPRINIAPPRKPSKKIEHFEEQAKKYLALLDANDEQERQNPTPSFNKKELQKKLESVQKRIGELNEQLSEIEENGDIAITDPDSKMMLVKSSGREVSHNVQIAVDSKNHLVIAVDVTSEAIDREQLYHVAQQAKTELGISELSVVADKGYYSAKQFTLCEAEGITAYAPKPTLRSAPDERYAKDRFIYDEHTDTYLCPQGAVLSHTKKRATAKYEQENYANPAACRECAARSLCTQGKNRIIQEPKGQRAADRTDARTKQHPEYIRMRKCLVEHPFGTIKRALGYTYFLTRRTESVRAESAMHFLIYNMKRVLQILGTAGTIQAVSA